MVSRKQLFQNALEDANSFRRTRKLDTDDLGEIWGMCNQAGEYVMLEEAIQINQIIEGWMFSLEFAMKHAVSKQMLKCYHAYDLSDFKTWISEWPTQFILVTLESNFTDLLVRLFDSSQPWMFNNNSFASSGTNRVSIRTNSNTIGRSVKSSPTIYKKHSKKYVEAVTEHLRQLLADMYGQIDELTSLILEQLNNSRRITLNSLIIQRVHCRDIIINMLDNGVQNSTDFLFKVQIKFFLQPNLSPDY